MPTLADALNFYEHLYDTPLQIAMKNQKPFALFTGVASAQQYKTLHPKIEIVPYRKTLMGPEVLSLPLNPEVGLPGFWQEEFIASPSASSETEQSVASESNDVLISKIKLPTKSWTNVKSQFRTQYNAILSLAYQAAETAWQHWFQHQNQLQLKEELKQRDILAIGYHQKLINLMYETREHDEQPLKPKKKWFKRATNRTTEFTLGPNQQTWLELHNDNRVIYWETKTNLRFENPLLVTLVTNILQDLPWSSKSGGKAIVYLESINNYTTYQLGNLQVIE